MKPKALTLEELGLHFWGEDWQDHMSDCLDVPKKAIEGWVKDPAKIPPGTEDTLRAIGQGRLEEIQTTLDLLAQRGLSREQHAVEISSE